MGAASGVGEHASPTGCAYRPEFAGRQAIRDSDHSGTGRNVRDGPLREHGKRWRPAVRERDHAGAHAAAGCATAQLSASDWFGDGEADWFGDGEAALRFATSARRSGTASCGHRGTAGERVW